MSREQYFKPLLYLRAAIYWLVSISLLPVVVFFLLMAFPFSVGVRYQVASIWARTCIVLLKWICGVDYKVEGLENLPQGAAIVMSNHQSTWETLVYQQILPPQLWVLKRELLRLPLFGWGLALCEPIAIDRGAGRKAMDQVIEQGNEKLKQGRWVIIFPEGTRVLPGKKKRYKLGGATLAANADYPIVPIAHNAGEYWPRHSFIKWPGTIRVVIGPPIHGYGRDPEEVNAQVEHWIETKQAEISNPDHWS